MSKKIALLTIFPEIFSDFLSTSLIGKAIDKDLFEIDCIDLRDYAEPPHYKVDDEIYGGGAGMLLKPEPLFKAISDLKKKLPKSKVVLLSASGKLFKQSTAEELAQADELIIIAGRYEGVDARVIDELIDYELCLGDFICMGGETPAMVMIEAITRLYPNVLGNPDSIVEESFSNQSNLLEAPQYTRPPEFNGQKVPKVLTSGNHEKIKTWRSEQSILKTKKNRSDLMRDSNLIRDSDLINDSGLTKDKE